jgi:hypothetical protein
MSKEIIALEQKQVKVAGVNYLITALPAEYGLEVMNELYSSDKEVHESFRIKEIILKSVTMGGVKFTSDAYDKHFSRKYKEIFELYNEIMSFNYGTTIEEDDEGNG